MRSAVATTVLAVLLLNAGIFASDNRAYLRIKVNDTNITVLTKNQAWPIKSQMTIEPCALASCVGV